MNRLPTICVVHPREKRRKCTLQPLRGREGFVFWNFPRRGALPLDSYLRLGIGGQPLTPKFQAYGLLVLDGTWKLAQRMERDFASVPLVSLDPDWRTAYPRSSKVAEDPAAGLATIEAVFAAYVQLGLPSLDLLNAYHWRSEFLDRNRDLIARHEPAPDPV